MSWVLNAYAIVFAALMVPAGRLADRVGRKRAFLAGMLALRRRLGAVRDRAPSVAMLVGARVIQAAGAALLMPTSLALLLPEFAPAERPAAIGIWAAVGGIAAAAGPPLGGLLVEASWRLVFLVNVPVGLVAPSTAAARLLRESSDPTQPRPDLLGTAMLAASVGAARARRSSRRPTGAGATRARSARSPPPWPAWRRSGRRCATHPVAGRRARRCCGCARSRWRAPSSLLFSAAFAAMLLGSVLFMTGVWGDSVAARRARAVARPADGGDVRRADRGAAPTASASARWRPPGIALFAARLRLVAVAHRRRRPTTPARCCPACC